MPGDTAAGLTVKYSLSMERRVPVPKVFMVVCDKWKQRGTKPKVFLCNTTVVHSTQLYHATPFTGVHKRHMALASIYHMQGELSESMSPEETLIYIQEQQQIATAAMESSDIAEVVASYMHCMQSLCQKEKADLDYTSLSAILQGTANMYGGAPDDRSTWDQQGAAQQQQAALLCTVLEKLQQMVPESTADVSNISSIFWSFGQLGVDPNALVPGVLDSLAQQFTLGIHAASGQSLAQVLKACSQLQLDPLQGELIEAILSQLDRTDMACFSSQCLADVTLSLSRLPTAEPSENMLDSLCSCFFATVADALAQDIADFVYGLQALRHLPPDPIRQDLASAMMHRMLQLCNLDEQQPRPQNISNFLCGCAQLTLAVSESDAKTLVAHHLSMDEGSETQRDSLMMTAWSLAVLGHLELETLSALVKGIVAVHLPLSSEPKFLPQLWMAMQYVRLMHIDGLGHFQAMQSLLFNRDAFLSLYHDSQQSDKASLLSREWQALKELLYDSDLGEPLLSLSPLPTDDTELVAALKRLHLKFEAPYCACGFQIPAALFSQYPKYEDDLWIIDDNWSHRFRNKPSR